MSLFRLYVVAMLIAAPLWAQAQEETAESRAKIEKPTSNTTPGGEEIDETITNNLLRAYSGSTSRWSVMSALTYDGGSINQPFSEDRPNIAASTGTIVKSLLDGQVSAKYNLNAQHSVMAGVGIRWIAPLQPGGPSNYDGTTIDADNPYLQYQYIYKWLGVQSVLQVQLTQFTNANLVNEGYVGQLNVDQENMYEVGKTGLSLGFSTYVQSQWFNRTGPLGTPGTEDYLDDVRTDQSDYAFYFAPEIEYQFTEKVNFRSIIGLWSYEHKRSEGDPNTYFMDKVNVSVGIGFSITRDIFLYPNIQFLPDQYSPNLTNVGLNANINVF